MTLWTNSYDRRSDRRYDPTGHLMTVKTTVDSTGGPIVRLIPFYYKVNIIPKFTIFMNINDVYNGVRYRYLASRFARK